MAAGGQMNRGQASANYHKRMRRSKPKRGAHKLTPAKRMADMKRRMMNCAQEPVCPI